MENQKEITIPGEMKFRLKLLHTSKQLTDDDLDYLKVLVAGVPGKPGYAEIENAKKPIDFFMLLVKNGDISENNCQFLKFMLNSIGRIDLAKDYEKKEEDTSRHSESDNSIGFSSPSPSPSSTSGVTFSPTSPDSGFETPPPQSSQIPQTTPLSNTLPQATSTPHNSRDAAASQVLKNKPQTGSKSNNQMPHLNLPPPGPVPSLPSKQQELQRDNSTSQKASSRYDAFETPKSSRTNVSADQEKSSLPRSLSHEIKSKELNPAPHNQQKRIFSNNGNQASSHHQSQNTKSPSQTAPTSRDDSVSLAKSPTKGKPPDVQGQDPAQPITDPVRSHIDHLEPHQRLQSPPLSSSPGSFGYRTLSSQVGEDILEAFSKKPLDPDDMGPTIQSPSVSLSENPSMDKSANRTRPLDSKDRASDPLQNILSEQSQGHKASDQNFKQLMKTVIKESSNSQNQPAVQSDDLEIDAPDDDDSIPHKQRNEPLLGPAIIGSPKDTQLFKAFPPLQATSDTRRPNVDRHVTQPLRASQRLASPPNNYGGVGQGHVKPPPGFTHTSFQMPQSQYVPLKASSGAKQATQQFIDQDKDLQVGLPVYLNEVSPKDDLFHHILEDQVNSGVSQHGESVSTTLHKSQDQTSTSELFPTTGIQLNQVPSTHQPYFSPGIENDTVPIFSSPPEPSRSVDPFSGTIMAPIQAPTSDDWPSSYKSDLCNSSVPDWKAPRYTQTSHLPKTQASDQTYQNKAPGSRWPDSTHINDSARHDNNSKGDPSVRRKVKPSRNPANPSPSSSKPSSESGITQKNHDSKDSSTPADQVKYSSRRQQIATPVQSETKSTDMEELKKKVSASIAKQGKKSSRKLKVKLHNEELPENRETKILRKYQEELTAPAKSGDNYIICAPTGSGKTLTAASICLHFYEKSKTEKRPFKALFIVNIRHLTEQQTAAFQETLPAGTVGTIGETELLKGVFFNPAYCVVMVTAQILVNALKKVPTPDLNLPDISMIIFDECHHTTQDHPYNEIMKQYLREKKSKLGNTREVGRSGHWLPQIVGLSASLGVGHEKDAYRHVLTLCSNMDARNVTQVLRHKSDLESHVNSPEQDEIMYASARPATTRDLTHIISGIMSEIESHLWDETPPHATQIYEQWIVNERKGAECNSDRNQIVACLYLFEYNRALLLYEDLRAIDAYLHLEKFMEKRYVNHNLEPIEELCRELFTAESTELKMIAQRETASDNPKLEQLAKLLRQKFLEKPRSKGIVLTRMRLATIALVDFIKDTEILRGQRVKPIRLVGQGEVDNFFMSESQQKEALKRFRTDDSYNLLVATDIAQEGLDMPECNFVIRYNFVSNEIGTVQSKGRARAKQSQCFLIVEKGSSNAKRELENRQQVISMQVAMDKLNKLPESQRLDEITKRQDEIYKEMEAKDEKAKVKIGFHKPELIDAKSAMRT